MIAFELKYLPETLFKYFVSEGEEIEKMLNGYISYPKKSKQGASVPGASLPVREDAALYSLESFEDSNDVQNTTL